MTFINFCPDQPVEDPAYDKDQEIEDKKIEDKLDEEKERKNGDC